MEFRQLAHQDREHLLEQIFRTESERHGAATNTAAGACTDRQVAATTLDPPPRARSSKLMDVANMI